MSRVRRCTHRVFEVAELAVRFGIPLAQPQRFFDLLESCVEDAFYPQDRLVHGFEARVHLAAERVHFVAERVHLVSQRPELGVHVARQLIDLPVVDQNADQHGYGRKGDREQKL